MKQYCPECIIELQPESKKLGNLTRWMKCPNCGFRERPYNEAISERIHGYSSDRIKRQNKNITKFNGETVD